MRAPVAKLVALASTELLWLLLLNLLVGLAIKDARMDLIQRLQSQTRSARLSSSTLGYANMHAGAFPVRAPWHGLR